ncbi:MAG: sorbosone dehydrogenase family protein [Gammaproteobacteria bacterium]|nr:sorbosone dehydrogenase family protein [Gammaproteobacteria bacterium]
MRAQLNFKYFFLFYVFFSCAPVFADAVLTVPPGFKIERIATVPKARSMVWGEQETLFVSTQFAGKIYAVTNIFSTKPLVQIVAEGLRISNGIAFYDGDLYVAEATRIIVYRDIEARLEKPGVPEVIIDNLPAEKLHSWKYLAFGPDKKLYVSIGAPCNICEVTNSGMIARMNPDGTDFEAYARGIRNSVGFAWHPLTAELWFTDNNRDLLGDDKPLDELNKADRPGLHFGFPFCHGAELVEPDADLAALGSCNESVGPVQELGPHVAPLGIAFYTGMMFPQSYKKQVFIAEHGSWNRSEKIGYRISLVRLDKAGQSSLSYEPFAEGWLQDGKVSGRPVDLLVAPDGSLLVSEDKHGAIYRISYTAGSIESE